jgi:hypothetical protein
VPIDAPRDSDSGGRLFILFSEAVSWIAYRNLNGAPPIGPRQLSDLPEDDEEGEYLINQGKALLAQQLLLDFGSRGRIRILSREWEARDKKGPCLHVVEIPAEFLSRATSARTGVRGYELFIPGQARYCDLAVDYHDLTEVFWPNHIT